MENTISITDNIRLLRNYYGETQKELAEAIGVCRETVTSYESGRTTPDPGMLSMIADHFMISVEELTRTDYRGIMGEKLVEGELIGKIDKVCPIIEVESVDDGSVFGKAIKMHKRLFAYLSKMDFSMVELAADTVSLYEESSKEGRYPDESIANGTGISLIIECMCRTFPHLYEVKPVTIVSRLSAYERSQIEYRGRGNYDFSMRRTSLSQGTGERIDQNIRHLKNTKNYPDLGYYYMALRFMWCEYDNGRSWELNRLVGWQMMEYLSGMKNPYAVRFVNL